MGFLDKIIERKAVKYGKGCARAMFLAASVIRQEYLAENPTYAWIGGKALSIRPNWTQISNRTFRYKYAPKSSKDKTNQKDESWFSGEIITSDDKSVRDIILDVIRIELFWNYLRDVEDIGKRMELIAKAVNAAEKQLDK